MFLYVNGELIIILNIDVNNKYITDSFIPSRQAFCFDVLPKKMLDINIDTGGIEIFKILLLNGTI